MPTPLRLSDVELNAVFGAARPLQLEDRDTFLAALAHALRDQPMVPGVVYRTCAELQRQFLVPPDFTSEKHERRWSRRGAGIRA